jgi:hypothetical protein
MSNKHPTSVQMLKDLKAVGCSSGLIDGLLEELQDDESKLLEVEKLFKSHQYNEHSIIFSMNSIKINIESYISGSATQILHLMIKHMRNGTNLLQISLNDLLTITNITSKQTIKMAINELIEIGCIAIKFKGKGRIASIYMINPMIATIGNCNKDFLICEFWKLTGTTYNDYGDVEIYSNIHSKFIDIIAQQKNYSIGYDKQETTNGILYFNKINPPKIDTKKSSIATNTIDENNIPI